MIGAGGVASGSNPAYKSPRELVHHFKTVQAKYVFAQVECLEAIEQAVKEASISNDRLFILNPHDNTVPPGLQPWNILLSYGECDWESNSAGTSNFGGKVACYSTTSGTTGLPKASSTSHKFCVAQSLIAEKTLSLRQYEVCLPSLRMCQRLSLTCGSPPNLFHLPFSMPMLKFWGLSSHSGWG